MSIVAMLQGSPLIDTATLRSAAALARLLKRPLTGLCALPDPLSALMVVSTPEFAGMSAAASQTVVDMQRDMLAAAETSFRSVVSDGGYSGESTFVHQVSTTESAAAGAATLADALVFPRSAAKAGEALSIAFDHVMMDARLPVLLAGTKPFEPGPTIIGWDGSNGVSRAVRFFAELIAAQSEAIIAQNPKDAERDGARPYAAPASLEAWLKQRGVKTRTEKLDGDVGSALLNLASATDASLIIAGAYGHSRIGERLFGGTSRRLLEASDAPALALAR